MEESQGTVLVVDDDAQLAEMLSTLLSHAGIRTVLARSGAESLRLLEGAEKIDAVITDLQMPEMDGIQLLTRIVQTLPELPVMVLTGFGTVPQAVEAMKAGATDFLLKPFKNDELLFCVRKALARTRLLDQQPARSPIMGHRIVTTSPEMQKVEAHLRRAAAGNATVLLRGESGTGKELAARALHASSPRHAAPFVKLHCAALPETLLESELFGYEKGAFTGAVQRKPGRVELAEGGTLFLDEIGDVQPSVQVKLLRLLQDREFERLGGQTSFKANVRFVAATHRPLEAMVERGEFREDLFYRLNVVPIYMPPLRARPSDIAPLAHHFCQVLGQANGKVGARLEQGCEALLTAYAWPGNVRQLQNVLERLVVLSPDGVIRVSELEPELSGSPPGAAPDLRKKRLQPTDVLEALKHAGGNRSLAARLLGVSRRTLYNKLAELSP